MDNKTQNILQKFSKKKVDLGTLWDKAFQQEQIAQSIFNDARRDAEQKILEASGEVEKAKDELKKIQNKIDNSYKEAIKRANDIGVDLRTTSVGKKYSKAFNEINDYIMSSTEIISKIRKFNIR